MFKKIIAVFALLFTSLLLAQVKTRPIIPYRDGNKWGFCDTLGKTIVAPYFDELVDMNYSIFEFNLGRFVAKKNNEFFVVDQKNQLVLAPTKAYDFVKINPYNSKMIELYKNNKMGFCFSEKEKSLPEYDELFPDIEGRVIVKKDNKFGVVNYLNKTIVPIQYITLHRDSRYDTLIKTHLKFKWYYQDADRKEGYIEDQMVMAKSQTNEEDDVVLTKTISDIDIRGLNSHDEKRLFKQYDKIESVRNSNFYLVYSNNKVGVFDIEKEALVLAVDYDNIETFLLEKIYFKAIKNNEITVLNNRFEKINTFAIDDLYYDRKVSNFVFVQSGKKGIFYFNNYYKYIPAKYADILEYHSIPISRAWNFTVFKVKNPDGTIGFVGENGVEYFKN